MAHSNTIIVAIGANEDGEFSLGHKKNITKLTQLKIPINKNMISIHSGFGYTIYANHTYQQYYAAGYNVHDSCGTGPHHIQPLTECKPIKYFKQKNININKVCVTASGSSTFWLTNNQKVYGNGLNTDGQLGLDDDENRRIPVLIHTLKDIIDIQSTSKYSVAIQRKSDDIPLNIINHWTRLIQIDLPKDVINLIITFGIITKIFTTVSGFGKKRISGFSKKGIYKWQNMKIFDDKHICAIAAGDKHVLFLENNGILWSMDDKQRLIAPIRYFLDRKIRIKQMQCGQSHNLAVDGNGRVYSWGSNVFGQCGNINDDKTYFDEPRVIETLKECHVRDIQCGFSHSYVATVDGKHYLFGNNSYNQCVVLEDMNKVMIPHCIDEIVKEIFDGRLIKSVSLGFDNTKLILSHDSSEIF